jgi:hypothetical protein
VKVPILLIIRNGLHALTRKFAEILVSSLATVLVMALFPYTTKPPLPLRGMMGGYRPLTEGPRGNKRARRSLISWSVSGSPMSPL